MFIKRLLQFQPLQRRGKNFNVCGERMRYEFQCLKEKSQNYNDRISNSNVWKNKIRIPMLIETGIEYQYYLQGEDHNSNVYRNSISMFWRIRSDSQKV